MKVTIGVSNHHVHLTKEATDILFGQDYQLTKLRDVNQPGQFAANEKVTIKSPKSIIENVRVLGPIRPYNQVEISKTDAIKLGLNPPIRDSGDLKGSSPITLIGPKGQINLEEGCIIATRHIHITPLEAKEKGLIDTKEVKVKVESEKGGILDHVHIKIAEKSYYEMHIDTDDANANLLVNGSEVEIIK